MLKNQNSGLTLLFYCFYETRFHYVALDWPRDHYVDQASLKLMAVECEDFRHLLLRSVYVVLGAGD